MALRPFEGIINFLQNIRRQFRTNFKMVSEFTVTKTCTECDGISLKKRSLAYQTWTITHIGQLAMMDYSWGLGECLRSGKQTFSDKQNTSLGGIERKSEKENWFSTKTSAWITSHWIDRFELCLEEAQRISLATQIGTQSSLAFV